MSQNKGNNRTMIGTVAPVIPTRPPVTGQQPAGQPPATGQQPVAAPHQQPTISPAVPMPAQGAAPGASHQTPTVVPGAQQPYRQPSDGMATVALGPHSQPGSPQYQGPPSQPGAYGAPAQPGSYGAPAQPGSYGAPAQPGSYGSQHSQPGMPSQPGAYGGPPSQPGQPPAGPASYAGYSLAGADPDLFIGQELGGYLIQRKLAEGGMGVVFEGVHGKIGRRGAIKVLKLEFCRSDDVVERFYQEARAVNSIRHENIVDIYDFGRDPYGRVFFVMEYLEGEPLSARIHRGALSWPEAFPILEQTLRALKAAHDKGFVHRDLKPDNIWLRYVEGRVQVKLLDFGIAKLVGTESPKEKLTQTGSVIGTPHYMSPEQINGSRDVDHRTDIYAMGVITYEMFSGVTPFGGETLQAVMTGHLFREPPRLAELPENLGVPIPIAEIVDRMLVKDAAGRYESVTDVLSDLHDVARNQLPARAETLNKIRPTRPTGGATGAGVGGAVQQQQLRQATPPAKKSKRGALIGALAAAALGAGGLVVWQTQKGSGDPAPVAAKAPATAPAPAPTPATPPAPVEKSLDYDAVRKDALALLRSSLQRTEPAVRSLGADAVGKAKDQPSVPVLTERAEKDDDLGVRGHMADALGQIGAADAAKLLAKLEAAATPAVRVWYTSALARLGDKGAQKRLIDQARDKDLAVSLKAGLSLAEVSQPGDKKAIAALRAIAARGTQLNEIEPFAFTVVVGKLASLRDPDARKTLAALLADKQEGVRIAAAEQLAQLGDDSGKQVLQDILGNQGSPAENRLAAAVAQIPLGEYGGLEQITARLGDKNPAVQRVAARGLGEIGERKSLPALIDLSASHPDWAVRVTAAAAIVAIVGLDPVVLAQASVDWTKNALASTDAAVRIAAAGVLADIPEPDAVKLLAQAFDDSDKQVRLAAAKSAGKLKTAAAATQIAAATKAEKDPLVKEQQVKALGEIGNPAVKDALKELVASDQGRVGVFAAGSLIAVGDPSGKEKLDAAVAAPQTDIRLAAVQAASTAKNPIVVPTLKTGLGDKVFDVSFAAAEGLAGFGAEKAVAVPVLEKGLKSKDSGVLGRAMAGLVKFGEKVAAAKSPDELLDSPDPKLRLAAVPIVRALPTSDSVPLLRRLVADPDQDVRRAGVEAIEGVAGKDKDQAIKLYKPLVTDEDPVIRSKAAGQLARLVEPPPAPVQTAAAPPPPTPAPDPTPVVAAVPEKVTEAAKKAAEEAAESKTLVAALDTQAGELKTAAAATTGDEAAQKRVDEAVDKITEAATKLDERATSAEAAAKSAETEAAAAPSPEATKLVEEAKASAVAVREAATAARAKATSAQEEKRRYSKVWTSDLGLLLTNADLALDQGNTARAKQHLDEAVKVSRATRRRDPMIDYQYGRLYDQLAEQASDPAQKRKYLEQAASSYQRYAPSGTGVNAQKANARLRELPGEISGLGAP